MVLINKQPKLSCHMAAMSINDRRLIKPVMLICFCSAMFLLYGVNIISFSNDHNIVSSLISGAKTNLLWNSWVPFFKCLKVNLRLGGRRSKLLQ